MARIYLSYNMKDSEIAKELTVKLKSRNHTIAIEHDSISPGFEWRSTLMDGLKTSDCLVVLLTENSLKSQFVLGEIGAARAFMLDNKKMLIIPIIFGDMDIPDVIRDILAIRSGNSSMDEIADKIDSAILTFLGRRAALEKHEEEVRTFIESNSASYIEETIQLLTRREVRNRQIAYTCYVLGFISLVVSFFVAFLRFTVDSYPNITWHISLLFALKGLIIIGLIIACSKYTFTLGKAFMNESLKNADRIHAISFGKFYLKVFGDKITWKELKEVFQHWNIDTNSVFSKLDSSQFDPKFHESITEIGKVIAQIKQKGR